MAVDIAGIYSALLEQWADYPGITQAQFANGVEQRGIATKDQADAYVDHFTRAAVDLAMMDTADWATLQARVQEVGLARATRASVTIHAEVVEVVEYALERAQAELVVAEAELAAAEAKLPVAPVFRDWVEANAPGTAHQKETALEIVDHGTNTLQAIRDGFALSVQRLQRRIEQLGG